jgi:hypothetical protein
MESFDSYVLNSNLGSAGALIPRLKSKFGSVGMAKLVGKGVEVKSGRPHYRSPPRSFKTSSQNRK